MDPDAPWALDDVEETTDDTTGVVDSSQSVAGASSSVSNIPSGPPVPNPYAHVLDAPCKKRVYTHWARPLHLRYKMLTEYYLNYYDDYIDYMNRRQRGLYRDVPRPQEWAERVFRVYTRDGKKLSGSDYKYWLTYKNVIKPKCSIFHAVHSKGYYERQYHSILC